MLRVGVGVLLVGMFGQFGLADTRLIAQEDWAWLRYNFSFFDHLDQFDATQRDRLLKELASWATPQSSATVYDQTCRPIHVEPGEKGRGLVGKVRTASEIDHGTKTDHFDQVEFDYNVTVVSGSDVTSRRANQGHWQEESTTAQGCMNDVFEGLWKVNRDGAWYNATDVTVQVTQSLDRSDGKTGSVFRLVATGRHGELQALLAPAADLERLRRIVDGKHLRLLPSVDEPPVIFRTRAACERYRWKIDPKQAWTPHRS